MTTPDEVLDAAAAAAHRRDVRRTAVFTAVALALVLLTSVLVVIVGGIDA